MNGLNLNPQRQNLKVWLIDLNEYTGEDQLDVLQERLDGWGFGNSVALAPTAIAAFYVMKRRDDVELDAKVFWNCLVIAESLLDIFVDNAKFLPYKQVVIDACKKRGADPAEVDVDSMVKTINTLLAIKVNSVHNLKVNKTSESNVKTLKLKETKSEPELTNKEFLSKYLRDIEPIKIYGSKHTYVVSKCDSFIITIFMDVGLIPSVAIHKCNELEFLRNCVTTGDVLSDDFTLNVIAVNESVENEMVNVISTYLKL